MLLALFLDLKNKPLSLPFVDNLMKQQSLEKEDTFFLSFFSVMLSKIFQRMLWES